MRRYPRRDVPVLNIISNILDNDNAARAPILAVLVIGY